MRPHLAFALLAFSTCAGAAEVPKVRFVLGPALPKGGEIILVSAGKPGPTAKGFEAALRSKEFGEELELPGAGPYDAYFAPKGGQPVLALAGWKAEAELKLSAHLGTVLVRGDDLPRVGAVVLTLPGDAGPGEKGHAAIQSAGDYKGDLVVPPGFYAVWIVPVSGAKAQRVADKIRVLAGRETQVPE